MAYIGNEWLIIDATNDVVTNDYTDSLYASPSFLSFSENGNIYVVKITAACTWQASIMARQERQAQPRSQFKKALPCVKKEGDTLVAKVSHAYGGWSYVGGTYEMERFCSQCNSRETKQGQAGTPYWYGKILYRHRWESPR